MCLIESGPSKCGLVTSAERLEKTHTHTHTSFFLSWKNPLKNGLNKLRLKSILGSFFCFLQRFCLRIEKTLILECVCPLIATRTKVMRRVLVSILAVDCWETPTGWEEKACMFTSLKIWPFFLPFGSFWPFPKLDSPK